MKRISSLAICLSISLLASQSLFAQAGMSSMSVGATRAGIMLRSADIRVEEFVNYHRHELRLPTGDSRVELDTRWNAIPSGKAILQIGLATPRDMDPEKMRPLNLVLVIDRSGSMSGDRIANVKKALLSFTERLRDCDTISIVSYSTGSRIDLHACNNSNTARINEAIENIHASGSTNLHGGLMLGYEQAKHKFDPEKANRVVLLTDGIANVGKTDPETIVKESKVFNKLGIDLSTIGLGHDFNKDLLRQLSDAGRGALHFVGDSKDIKKTFVEEIDSLLSPAADKVVVTLEGDINQIKKIYGYTPENSSSKLKFKLDDMSHGATQVILCEVKDRRHSTPITVTLRYTDKISGQSETRKSTVDFTSKDRTPDPSLTKNHLIARLANSIRKSAKHVEENNFVKAKSRLTRDIKLVTNTFEKGADKDIDRIITIAKQMRDDITTSIADNRH